jgi:hypothetical protein
MMRTSKRVSVEPSVQHIGRTSSMTTLRRFKSSFCDARPPRAEGVAPCGNVDAVRDREAAHQP